MRTLPGINRRAVGRALTEMLEASVGEVLDRLDAAPTVRSHRIGITGPPGAGKSTLVSLLGAALLERGRSLGILAIDPTSPVSRGSVLGDRIRMDAIADDPRLFIRSVPSRGGLDGLCDNAGDLVLTMERQGFDTVVLETVGVGQSEVAVRHLVDTMVLVVPPGAGDSVQAMKAGVTEIADVYVVNKADMPEAERTRRDIAEIVDRRAAGLAEEAWRPRVVVTGRDGTGIAALADVAIERESFLKAHGDPQAAARRGRSVHLHGLLSRHAREIMETDETLLDRPLGTAYRALLARMLGDLDETAIPAGEESPTDREDGRTTRQGTETLQGSKRA